MRPLHYAFWESPLGWLAVVADTQKLKAVVFRGSKRSVQSEVSGLFPEASEEMTDVIGETFSQLQEFFAGNRHEFDLPIDYSDMTTFSRLVLEKLSRVPFGERVSYAELAARSGRPGAARAVGRIMACNPLPLVVPCHRVVGANGKMTGYSGGRGIASKEWLLALEEGCASK